MALVVSGVLPVPRESGQQQRVANTLQALRRRFHTTFLGIEPDGFGEDRRRELDGLCDEVILSPARYSRTRPVRLMALRTASVLSSAISGLRRSNFITGAVELSPARLDRVLNGRRFDCALFEYWHAAASLTAVRKTGAFCVLDMHDILWRSWERRLGERPVVPRWWRRWAVNSYRRRELAAWSEFDAVIAINRAERDEVKEVISHRPILLAPMGVDLNLWQYSWKPSTPPRVAFYGGLGNPDRQRDAMRAYRNVMPAVWRQIPEAEFWLIGSNPPSAFGDLERRDPRVHVTGYVRDVQGILATVTALLCPWSGTFGFRSRLIEAMAIGVPVVASRDAVWGMELETGRGIAVGDDDESLARSAVRLLSDEKYAREQSGGARQQVEDSYSFDETYGKLALELHGLSTNRRGLVW